MRHVITIPFGFCILGGGGGGGRTKWSFGVLEIIFMDLNWFYETGVNGPLVGIY